MSAQLDHDTVTGVVEGVIELVRSGQKEKVVRVGLLALKQLLQDPSLGYGATLVDASLLKLVTTRSMQAGPRRTSTPDPTMPVHCTPTFLEAAPVTRPSLQCLVLQPDCL